MIIGFDASRAFGGSRTGTENYSYELLKALLAVDTTNWYRVYLRNGAGVEDELLKGSQVEVVAIHLSKLWTQLGLAKEVLLRQPDVLFIPAHTLPVIHRPGLTSIVTIHDLGAEYLPQYHQFPQKLYLNRSTEYAVGHATHLIAVSQATKDDLIKRLHANPAKITVVHEGFDASKFQPQSPEVITKVREKCGISGNYCLFVGTIQPRKNLERLIEAFARVIREDKGDKGNKGADTTTYNLQPTTLQLVLAGKKGWLSEAIYAAPRKFGVEGQVKFIDYVVQEDLAALYSGALVFTFPSLFEGFGLPILEAMACRTPVLTSNTSSMPEVGGEAAYYIDPTSVESIAQGLSGLIADPDLRRQLVDKGKEQVKKFSWEKTAKETVEVFQRIS